MKKLLVIVGILIIGGGYYVSSMTQSATQKAYENTIASLEGTENIKISNKSYTKGFFSSKGSFDILVSPIKNFEKITDIKFGFETKPIKLRLESKINSVLAGGDIDTKIKVLNEEGFKKFFNSDHIANANTSLGFDGKANTKISFNDIERDGINNLKISGAKINFSMGKDKKISKFGLELKAFEVGDLKASVKLKDIKYSIHLKTPATIKDTFTKLLPTKNEYSIDNISIQNPYFKVELAKLKSEGETSIDPTSELLKGKGKISFEKISFDDVEFKNFLYKVSIKNINVKSINKFLAFYRSSIQSKTAGLALNDVSTLNTVTEIFLDLASFKPEINVEKINIENKKNRKIDLTFVASILDFDRNNAPGENKYKFEGKLKMQDTLQDFLYQVENAQAIQLFQDKLFLKSGNDYVMSFRLDSEKKDFIFNDKYSYKEIF